MNVSYPFWIKDPTCGYPGFQIKCKSFGSQSTPFLPTLGGDFEITDIDYGGHVVINSTSLKAMSCNGTDDASVLFSLSVEGPFTISSLNRFAVIGCRSVGSFSDSSSPVGRCQAACLNQYDPQYCNCYGCCEAGIPGYWKSLNFTGGGFYFNNSAGACGFSTVLDPQTWSVPENEKCFFSRGRYGLRLDWTIGHQNCSAAKGTPAYSCDAYAECIDSISGDGHLCKCSSGYRGSGYSNGTGCTDIDECSQPNANECVKSSAAVCINFAGSYNCSCKEGYVGDGFQNGTRCEPTSSNNAIKLAIIGSVSSFVGVSLAACGILWWLRKRHMKIVKAKYFQHNGGIQLQQYIASKGGRQSLRIYSAEELQNASENFSDRMKLGTGGYATVYRGIFSDGSVVAIKKSKEICDVQEDDQFINEVIILSQINHRNVVKLLGCCLETKSPLLVYEFVENGTLLEHLHSKESCLPWEMRFQIAIETAEALAYLHSAAAQPIFHRDVKSSNILLDRTFAPKVADFGISRLLSVDDTHLTTDVMGTRGYMDPQYFQTFQLTDKSDVYSFGVVLVELLTGLRPLLLERPKEECTLSALFISKIECNCLTEILDPKIAKDSNQAEMQNVAMLARECLEVEGRRRPSMKQVVEELVWVRTAASAATTSHESMGRDGESQFSSSSRFHHTTESGASNNNMYRSQSHPASVPSLYVHDVRSMSWRSEA
ncbi:hypothetical protein SUGI_0538400 [Cryptomeria japonica]|nr:hypothetical protein SUGI_0538400 [Cryptomeria japonica]